MCIIHRLDICNSHNESKRMPQSVRCGERRAWSKPPWRSAQWWGWPQSGWHTRARDRRLRGAWAVIKWCHELSGCSIDRILWISVWPLSKIWIKIIVLQINHYISCWESLGKLTDFVTILPGSCSSRETRDITQFHTRWKASQHNSRQWYLGGRPDTRWDFSWMDDPLTQNPSNPDTASNLWWCYTLQGAYIPPQSGPSSDCWVVQTLLGQAGRWCL